MWENIPRIDTPIILSLSYDDGSYGPVLVRLAWHASGTYDKETKTGGSNGATMRMYFFFVDNECDCFEANFCIDSRFRS